MRQSTDSDLMGKNANSRVLRRASGRVHSGLSTANSFVPCAEDITADGSACRPVLPM